MERVCGGEAKAPADVKQEESENGARVLTGPGLLDVSAVGEGEVGTGEEQQTEVEGEVDQPPGQDQAVVKRPAHRPTAGVCRKMQLWMH